MLIQPIAKQSCYNNYQLKHQNPPQSFKGTLGKKVLQELVDSGVKDKAGISEVLTKLGIGTFGLLSLAKLKDILESIIELNYNLLDTQQTKLKEEYQTRSKKLASEEETVAAKIEELTEWQKELEGQEQAITNTERLMRQAEIDTVKSATMVFYGIEDPDITSYNSIGEQCLQISSTLNTLPKVKILNLNSTTLQELAIAMQNNEGVFTADTMKFLKRIACMHDFNINDLVTTMYIVKDANGNIDMNKSTHCLALYSLNNSKLDLINRELAKFYISPSKNYSISDAATLFRIMGVNVEINKEGIVATGDLGFDPRYKGSNYKICEELGINLNELFKYVVKITTDLQLRNNQQITDLPNLVSVSGFFDIANSSVTNIPKLEYIGGNCYCGGSSLGKTSLEKLKSITVGNFKE